MRVLQYPSRAHRRFLGLTLPPQLVVPDEDFAVAHSIAVEKGVKKAMYEHLSTMGQERGGILLGYQAGETLHITALLPNGYGMADPYTPQAQYVLGAVEAAQQHAAHPVDWVGSWLMPADGELRGDWCDEVWLTCKARGLLPLGVPVMTFGRTAEQVEVEYYAWIDKGEGRNILDIKPKK